MRVNTEKKRERDIENGWKRKNESSMRPSFFSHSPSMPRLSKCVHVRQCTRVQQDTSMVWLTGPTPSLLSEFVHARLREPSTEPALVREAVRERTRRVILAEGTERKREKERWIVISYPQGNSSGLHDVLQRRQGWHAWTFGRE